MQRKTRILLRAAKYLEAEAREYVQHGKDVVEDRNWAGQRAQIMFGIAHATKQIALAGYVPTNADQKSAARSMYDTERMKK